MINTSKLDQDAAITDRSRKLERIFYVATISILEHGNEREIHRLFSVPEDEIEAAHLVGDAVAYDSFSGDATWEEWEPAIPNSERFCAISAISRNIKNHKPQLL